jgi:hypothetical protein
MKKILGSRGQLMFEAYSLSTIYEPSQNPIGLHGLLQGELYFFV